MYKSKGKRMKAKETLQTRGNELSQLLAKDQRQLGDQGPSPYAKTANPGAKTPTTASNDKIAPRWV